MCGIFAVLNGKNLHPDVDMKMLFMKCSNRGPESSSFHIMPKRNTDGHTYVTALGFHRLAINGLDDKSNQPMTIDNVTLICNGEIYNHSELEKELKITPTTNSDCEIIIHLYIKYGMDVAIRMLDGVFAFVLVDDRGEERISYIARDPLGIRPLYIKQSDNQIAVASELKCIEPLFNNQQTNEITTTVTHFPPSTYYIVHDKRLVQKRQYYVLPSPSYISTKIDETSLLRELIVSAVEKRCDNTERPVACLLSGGLDSSLIAALVADYFRKKGKKIETFSIGLAESSDIIYAKQVAEYIGSIHTEVIVTEEEMFNAIPNVIYALETYDVTTIRASLGNYLLGKYISEHSNAKVIFNGDGSDELFGGYLYMNYCPNNVEFDLETRRLLTNIHKYDVLRSDKCISSHGLEPRTPFLDKTLVSNVLLMPPSVRNHNVFPGAITKSLLRRSFNIYNDSKNQNILPYYILYRKKEAFSDGVSSTDRSLFTILQEHIEKQPNFELIQRLLHIIPTMNLSDFDKIQMKQSINTNIRGIDIEMKYYKQIFDIYFKGCDSVIYQQWMPRYVNATDPSARVLDVYNK